MKEKIHPKYEIVTVSCTCGNKFQTRSTLCRDIKLEICSACHPFFTGKQKLIDTVGSLAKFERRYKKTGGKTVRRKPKVKAAPKKKERVKKQPTKKKKTDLEEDIEETEE
ncbi:MAG: 50S ribosomal protein L31 [Elusimicrobia bacterium]|nr:50S ribosomal protein L31 [Elusimicrobiota bacterium]